MTELGQEILKSASSRIDAPFRHHFKPTNLCESGKWTVDACMERGMNPLGYDCSGLAIASICDVLGMSPAEWPRELRHTQQLSPLASNEPFQPGDIRLFYNTNQTIHLGITTSNETVVHASGLSKIVEKSHVTGQIETTRTITAEQLSKFVLQIKP